jgi:hypothetical protein
MIAALSTIWSFRKAIGLGLAGLAVVAGLWYVRNLQIQNTSLRLERDQAIQVAQENAAIVATIQEQVAQGQKALSAVHMAEVARLKKSQKVLKEIADAQVTTACVDSPAIRSAFDGLRRPVVPQTATGQDTVSR